MLYTREQIESFNEDELSQNVLVPLLERMGFQDVFYHHGGPLEQGKDIVMVRNDEIYGTRNFAVVVKAKPITGNATIAGEIHTQIKQCFGKPFIDTRTNENRKIHFCYVICSKVIKKEGSYSLSTLLENDPHIKANTRIIDGDELVRLVKRHLPHILMLEGVQKGLQALNSLDPNYNFVLFADGKKSILKMKNKEGKNEPADFKIQMQFPNTEEGRLKQSELKKSFTDNSNFEVERKYIKHFSFPPILQKFLDSLDNDDFKLKFGPVENTSFSLPVSIKFYSSKKTPFTLPYIELKCIENEPSHFTLSNKDQPIPLKIIFIISKSETECKFTLSYDSKGRTFQSYLDLLRLQQAYSEGGKVIIDDYNSKLPIMTLTMPGSQAPKPEKKLISLVKKVEVSL